MTNDMGRFFTVLFFGSLVFCTQIQAQEIRLGFVKIERILRESNYATAAQTKLESEFSKRDKEINDEMASFKTRVDKLQIEAPVLPEALRATRQKQLSDQDRELQRKRRVFQEDLNARKNEQLQLVINSANKAVKQVAEAGKYDLVLQNVVYVNPKHDLTDKVIALLNSQTK